METQPDPLDTQSEAAAAAAFRRLARLLRHPRSLIHGMPISEWKAHQDSNCRM